MHSRLWFGSVLIWFAAACGSSSDDAAPSNSGGSVGQTGGDAGQAQNAGGFAAGGRGAGAGQGATGGAGLASAGSPSAAGQGNSSDVPSDTSADAIQAFIDAGNYRSATWEAGRTGPMEPPADSLSPHGIDYIWYNHVLRQSKADGHAGTVTDPFGEDSMAVKEMYTGSTVIGHAAMLHNDKSWVLFCTASESDRCYVGYVANTVVYSTGIANCGCHGGGTIVTAAEVPPP